MAEKLECEWMFSDAATGLLGIQAFAKYNPLRWSGPISFDECIKQLEEARPGEVSVKIPAGFSSKENIFSDIASAIAFVENSDPVRQRKKLKGQKAASEAELAERTRAAAEAFAAAEELDAEKLEAEKAERLKYVKKVQSSRSLMLTSQVQTSSMLMLKFYAETRAADHARMQAYTEECIKRAEEKIGYYEAALTEITKNIEELNAVKAGKTAAKAAAKDVDCEWMFGDLTRDARLNPLRWSGAQSFEVAAEKLESEKKASTREIVVKVPAGILSSERRFPDAQAAIDFIRTCHPMHLQVQTEELEASLQIAVKTMDDASDKLQEYKVELLAWRQIEKLSELF